MCREQYHAYSYYEMSGTASCGQWSSIQIQYNVHHPVAHSKGVTVKRWHTIPSMLLLRGDLHCGNPYYRIYMHIMHTICVDMWHTIPSILLLRGELSYAVGTMGFVRGGAD